MESLIAIGGLVGFALLCVIFSAAWSGIKAKMKRRRIAQRKLLIHSINDDRCTGCDACITVCPTDVLELVNNKSRVIRFDDCIQCEQCSLVCPTTALVMHYQGTKAPAYRMPNLDEYYQASPGLYLIGEAAGKPLVKNASNLGRAAVEHMAAHLGISSSHVAAVDISFSGDGSYAEYCAAKAAQFALKPNTISFNEAAAVPLAAMTAWTAIFACGKLQPGQRIAIQGASGGVGSFAVQFAKAKGAYVIGIASTDSLEHLRQIGADEVIDYKTQHFDKLLHDIDLVFDASPNRDNKERLRAISVLKEGGIFVSANVDAPFNEEVLASLAKKNAKGELAANQPRQDWLEEIAQLIDDGKVQVRVSKVFPLEEAAEAHRESETWHVRGKLVLQIRNEKETF